VYAAAGDSGAYSPGTTQLSAGDPASQPYVTGVGGTSLTTNGAGGPYVSETTWAKASDGSGGGGGISEFWTILPWQKGIGAASSDSRNVPDVSIDGDPQTGYSIYVGGAWHVFGGTSCGAPLWAAFNALVNEKRINDGGSVLGFASPILYAEALANPSSFHDINDGSTNLYYPATNGYDNATGLGSPNGDQLFSRLTIVPTPTPTPLPTDTPAPRVPQTQKPALRLKALVAGTLHKAFSLILKATHSPLRYILKGKLPPGLHFNATAGSISGTPTRIGIYSITVTAQNEAGRSKSSSFKIKIAGGSRKTA
jgi:hypothetical protein